MLIFQLIVSLVEIILSLHELIVLVVMIGIDMLLLALVELEVFLGVLDNFRFERSLYVVFLLQEKLAVHQDLVPHLVMHLIVKACGFAQVTLPLVIFSVLLALFGLNDLSFLDIFNEIATFSLLHVNVEVHFGKLIGLLLAIISRLVKVIGQSFLQAEAASA